MSPGWNHILCFLLHFGAPVIRSRVISADTHPVVHYRRPLIGEIVEKLGFLNLAITFSGRFCENFVVGELW